MSCSCVCKARANSLVVSTTPEPWLCFLSATLHFPIRSSPKRVALLWWSHSRAPAIRSRLQRSLERIFHRCLHDVQSKTFGYSWSSSRDQVVPCWASCRRPFTKHPTWVGRGPGPREEGRFQRLQQGSPASPSVVAFSLSFYSAGQFCSFLSLLQQLGKVRNVVSMCSEQTSIF